MSSLDRILPFLKPIEDLLLDPTNPRLITDSAQIKKYSFQQICAVETQDYVLDLVCSEEHDVAKLTR